MLKVTAELADGTLTWCTGPQTLAAHTVPTITAAAEAAGRPAPRVVAALPVCVATDVAAARERAAKVFAVYGQLPSYRAMLDREGAGGAEDIAVIGSAGEVVDRIGALGDIGVTDFAAVEFGGDNDEQAATREALVGSLAD
jgi:alkanesulfonate monooxygenase SsuD/methylene tetrahydromethanopterin reductase-like flavin-dependent oxidoreductase (luciferase family)